MSLGSPIKLYPNPHVMPIGPEKYRECSDDAGLGAVTPLPPEEPWKNRFNTLAPQSPAFPLPCQGCVGGTLGQGWDCTNPGDNRSEGRSDEASRQVQEKAQLFALGTPWGPRPVLCV